MKDIIYKICKHNGKWLGCCIFVTSIWGMVAHGYMFFHNAFSHDSLIELPGSTSNIAFGLGRFFVPIYRQLICENIIMPWLVGIESMCWIAISVFFITQIFDINSGFFLLLISGICVVNQTVIATAATYINILDTNMFALLMTVLTVFIWQKYNGCTNNEHNRKWLWGGGVTCCLGIGLYQSYISVVIVLVIIRLILDLLNGVQICKVIRKGFLSIIILLEGGILYLLALRVMILGTGVPVGSGQYNSLDKILEAPLYIKTSIVDAWLISFRKIFIKPLEMLNVWKGAYLLALFLICGIILCIFLNRKMSVYTKGIIFVLLVILPLGANISHILTCGMSHDLMHYAIWLCPILFLLIVNWWEKYFCEINVIIKKFVRGFIFFTIFIVLWQNVHIANTVYLKKNLVYEANLSLYTRILARIDDFENYFPGETLVVFAGRPKELNEAMLGFEVTDEILGADTTEVVWSEWPGYYQMYFDYILINPIAIADYETLMEIKSNPEVERMPCFPHKDCIKMINDVLVVKLGDI